MRKTFMAVALVFLVIAFTACGGSSEMTSSAVGTTDTVLSDKSQETIECQEEVSFETENLQEESAGMKMQVQIGESIFTASLEENEAVNALIEMMKETPLTIEMSDYSGFEKVGSLGKSLPSSNRQITTQAGDIVLFNSNQIVIFYGSNSWSYTRIGKIDDLEGWEEALGKGDITATFSLTQE